MCIKQQPMSSKIETKYNQITYLNENIFEIGDNKNKLMEEKQQT